MRFHCQSCSAKYQIADEKVGGKTIRMKCRKCGTTIQVRPTGDGEAEHVVDPSIAPVTMMPPSEALPPSLAPTASVPREPMAATEVPATSAVTSSAPPLGSLATPASVPASSVPLPLGETMSPRPAALPGLPPRALGAAPSLTAGARPPGLPGLPPRAVPPLPGALPSGLPKPGLPPRLPGARPLPGAPTLAGGVASPLSAGLGATAPTTVEDATVIVEAPRIPAVEAPPVPVIEAAPVVPFEAAPEVPFEAAPVVPFEAAPVVPFEAAPEVPFEAAPVVSFEGATVSLPSLPSGSGIAPAPQMSDPLVLTKIKGGLPELPGLGDPSKRDAADPLGGFDAAAPSPAVSSAQDGSSTLHSAGEAPSTGLEQVIAELRLESAPPAPAAAAPAAAAPAAAAAAPAPAPAASSAPVAHSASPSLDRPSELPELENLDRRQRHRGIHPMAWGLVAMCAALGAVAAWVILSPAPSATDVEARKNTRAAASASSDASTPASTAALAATAAGASDRPAALGSAEPGAVQPTGTGVGLAADPSTAGSAALMMGSAAAASAAAPTAAASASAKTDKGGPAPCDPRTDPLCSAVGGPDSGTGSAHSGDSSAGLSPEQLSAVVSRNRGAVQRACLPLVQNGAVKVNVSLTVGPSGNVTSANVSAGGGNSAVVSCVKSRVTGWQFPASGGSTQVSVPFQLIAQ
ncbi:MAG: zinc-ribbon domain-containing protein [Deltaproteobacteria bacterium]|nr:zinc-ribbon domain-containing protein [Deltaproteobacteria bacterium]